MDDTNDQENICSSESHIVNINPMPKKTNSSHQTAFEFRKSEINQIKSPKFIIKENTCQTRQFLVCNGF